MIHRPKEILQIRVHYPLVALLQLLPDLAECVLGGSPSPIPEVGLIEYRLENRLQPVEYRLLAYPIINRRNAERPILPRFTRLGNQLLPHRLRCVGAVPELLVQTLEVRVQLRLERIQTFSINPASTAVALHFLPGHLQILPLVNLVHQ